VTASASPASPAPATSRPTALVTGASGGIGEELARQLAATGHDLVLVARTEAKLAALAGELATTGAACTVVPADLAVPGAAAALARELEARALHIDVLVNNAGFADFGPFAQAEPETLTQMVQLNVVTLTDLTRALLPGMLARGRGRVLNVASTAAFFPGPLMSVYYATKAYVLSLSEALADELAGSGVTVTALCPGPTETGFQQRAAMEESRLVRGRRIMDASTVARLGVAGMLAGKRVVVTGAKNRLTVLSPRFLPRRVVPAMVRRAQAPH
jgi:hypothetical protein